jgi:hypothetical protein
MRSGHVKSCGCLHRDTATVHGGVAGYVESKEYTAWKHMNHRCTNVRDPEWPNYGGRGIRVCAAWASDFGAFLSDVGHAPRGHSLDRINNDGHYEPGNVRWATSSQQSGNTRRNVIVDMGGMRECVEHAAKRIGVPPTTVRSRLRRGWSAHDAFYGRGT